MANTFTDAGTVFANLLATGYDTEIAYQLRSRPVFRPFVDKHPGNQTNIGPSVILTIAQEFANLATTPLVETVDPDAVAPPAPNRVTVNISEYGNADITTLKLKTLAYIPPDPVIANVLGKNQIDTIDKLVQNQFDTATNILRGVTGAGQYTSGGVDSGIVAANVLDSSGVRKATTLLRRRNVSGRDERDNYVGIVHPDVAHDIVNDTGWLNPHQYVNTEAIYNYELGTYLGVRFIQSPRVTTTLTGASSAKVYYTYVLGAEGLVEAVVIEPHVVVGPQVDKLRRHFPIGWHGELGWAVYRQEAIQMLRTQSSVSGL